MIRQAVVLAVAITTPLVARVQTAQDSQAPSFRTTTETVAVYVTVLDRGGQMVLGLGRDDFEISDNGRRQELTTFVSGQQPVTAALLVDTSASMTLNLELARRAAEQFVVRMLPGDAARVGTFSDRVDPGGEFTSDRDRLLRRLSDGLDIGNPTRLWDAIDDASAALATRTGRRVVMLLTDGIDTVSRTLFDTLFTRARADDVMVYVVQFRTTARARLAEEPLSPTATTLFSSRGTLTPAQSIAALRRLSAQTGGGFFLLDEFDDVNTTFTDVMQELHHQYLLAFTPQRADGRVHEIQVRVKRPWLSVRARQTYQAPQAARRAREDANQTGRDETRVP